MMLRDLWEDLRDWRNYRAWRGRAGKWLVIAIMVFVVWLLVDGVFWVMGRVANCLGRPIEWQDVAIGVAALVTIGWAVGALVTKCRCSR